MPKKLKLDIDFSSDISLIAISCHKPNFWLAGQLNSLLKFDLRRMADLPYFHPSIKEMLNYVLYYYPDENSGITYFLIGNYNPDGKLFPEYRTADYLLMANGIDIPGKNDVLTSKIKSIKGILTAFTIENGKLKDLKNFISDLELHMIDQIKSRRP